MDIKLEKLKDILRGLESVLLAFSGGVDSTFILKVAIDTLGAEKVLAVIAVSETYPASEKQEAQKLGEELGAKTLVIETRELDNESFRRNPRDRCYYCKSELFSRLLKIAEENGLAQVIDGSNVDDLSDFRPGAKAKTELGISSPLQEAGLAKQEIRDLSRSLGLPTWDKPSYACLASRIPYGTRIEPETLTRLDEAENFLRTLGFKQLRVRHHGNLARIELEEKDIPRVLGDGLMDKINKKFATLGYIYVTIDLKGYRTGSLNEALI
ncbi:ATP-dependent sacrificial sulfur transferase LarE [Candidatus Saganbacteria bacterium]|nr:ATP-dependent sacrificial sulfur transferase LarE [Candidatus Saganbacteria bacterium]